MKQIILLLTLILSLGACHDIPIGYLQTEEAKYIPNEMTIRRELDPTKSPDNQILRTGADWASTDIQGILGTNPIVYEVIDVKASNGGNTELFMEQIKIKGTGRFIFPSEGIKAPNGTYLISIRISNEGYSAEIPDIFTIIIE